MPFRTFAVLTSVCLPLSLGGLLIAGCKPSATSKGLGATSSDDKIQAHALESPGQPSASDVANFMHSVMPPTLKIAASSSDQPVPMPNTSPSSHAWTVNVKLVLTPAEDLLSLPSAKDAHTVDALVDELNGLIEWRNAFAKTPYTRAYPAFEVEAPVSTVPQLLVVRQPRDKPLPPIYGKVAAEWQVDHWKFTNDSMELPADLGQLRSAFSASTMIKDSPEAEAFLAAERQAIVQAKEKMAALESLYAQDLLQATKPGTVYRGQITHHLGILPVVVQFTDQSKDEPHVASFKISLPSDPSYHFTYTAHLQLSIPVGLPQKKLASEETFRFPQALQIRRPI